MLLNNKNPSKSSNCLHLFSWTSVILLFLCCQWAVVCRNQKIWMNDLHLQIFFKEILTDPQNGHIPYRRSERRLLNLLVFTSSVVENYWENETLIYHGHENKSFIWQNSICTHFKVLKYFFHFISLSRILIKSFESFSKLCHFIYKIKKTFLKPSGIRWNMIQLFFFLGTFSVPPINFNSLGWVIIHTNVNFLMTTIRCVSKNGAQAIYTNDYALKFSILQENPSLKQTETPNFMCKLLSSWWYNLRCVI